MHKPGCVLLLVHQGLSYIVDVHRKLAELDLNVVALTSAPQPSADMTTLTELTAGLIQVERDYLEWSDVQLAMADLSRDFQLKGVIASFEGYRLLMAKANAQLRVADNSEESLQRTLDKFAMRQCLHAQGLTRAEAKVITAATLDELKHQQPAPFIKPRRGVASFGCFRLHQDITWNRIQSLQHEIEQDLFLRSAFLKQTDFIAETEIPGRECSFESLLFNDRLYTLCVHEKVGLDFVHSTVWETVYTAPPINLGTEVLRAGTDYLNRCLRALGLSHGAFHIEARFDEATGNWDVIEINPRIGGVFINLNSGLVNGGTSILDAWLMALVCKGDEAEASLSEMLGRLGQNFEQTSQGALGYSLFGEPGRIVDRVELDLGDWNPRVCQQLLGPGDAVARLSRETAVANLCWAMPKADIETLCRQLLRSDQQLIRVHYREPSELE